MSAWLEENCRFFADIIILASPIFYCSYFKGVIGTIVVNNDGIPIKSTLDNHTTTQYAGLINQLVDQVKS